MATIAIFVDIEDAHTLSTFWLSRNLKARGHRVCYLGPPHAERIVRNQGFDFISIMADIILKGIQRRNRHPLNQEHDPIDPEELYFAALVRGNLLDNIIAELRPNVALVLSEFYLSGLAIQYRYQLPIVYFTPMLRPYDRKRGCEIVVGELMKLKSGVTEFLELLAKAGVYIENFKDVAQLVLCNPELMLLPEAFDLPGRDKDPKSYYVGAGIDTERKEEPFFWPAIDSGRPLIYCAHGSQLQLNKEAHRRSLQTTIDAAAIRLEWQFIIAIGKVFKAEDFFTIPPNVNLFNWVPQLEVLSRSNVMINHGGFGTVKECIYMGVPMVVLPLKGFRDHPDCAKRVVHHGLGVQNDDPNISPSELILLIEQVINNPSFSSCVDLMREKFRRQDGLELAAEVIENNMARYSERDRIGQRS